ncbi:MAG: ABC transporter permease [Bacteroidia bacterium]|jgi:ABC-2 type transport system permease protein
MNKIALIIKREYLTRVKKKSFIIMTILGPILMAGIGVVPIYLSMQKAEKQTIEVIDESGLFVNIIPESDLVNFVYPKITIQDARADFFKTDYNAILYIPKVLLSGGQHGIRIFYKKQLSASALNYISDHLSRIIFDIILVTNNVNVNFIKNAKEKSTFTLKTTQIDEEGKDKNKNMAVAIGISLVSAFLIYFFIFLYGVQVMRGVMEEKTNRIVEVILSSVKPFQLMMGKIVGVALVGLTQFLLWVILTTTLYSVATVTVFKGMDLKQIQQKEQVIKIGANLDYNNMNNFEETPEAMKIWDELQTMNLPEILFTFLFYFLAGYLMYSALFAAVGSAVDNEADTQQFMLPITIPLIFAFIIAQNVIQDPSSPMAFWFSIIPLTSPVIMMVRIPFGVPPWELALSMGVLVLTFIFTTWIAGRIYRTGILMYGKKVTWKELGKWLFYKG